MPSTDPMDSPATRLTIDSGALVANWRALAARHPGAACSAVVKANAYGLGIETVVPRLAAAGCDTFFVAHLGEAVRVRAVAPRATVYVLNGLLPGAAPGFAAADLRPVLGSREEIDEWRAFRAATGWQGGAALHVDTGMGRLGVLPPEAELLAADGGASGWTLVMSHLACADTPDHPLNRTQQARFAAVRAHFPRTPASLLNSSGIFLPAAEPGALTRPGVALYGVNPTPGRVNPMRPVVRLEAPILRVRDVAAGESVGYGATFVAPRPMRVAVLQIGYADGYLRASSWREDGTGGAVVVAGERRAVLGRVSMDLTAIDVTGLPEAATARGSLVTVIGDGIDVDAVASRAGTIGYEILTSLGDRFSRRVQPD